MRSEHSLVGDNITLLRQGIELIDRLNDEFYSRPQPALGLGSVGGHFRHCLDFYASLLAGLASGTINYDARERDVTLESRRAAAIERVQTTIAALEGLASVDHHRELNVTLENSVGAGGLTWSRSTVARELQSLVSHTTHHYALIAVAMRLERIDPGQQFGVGSSTLRYWSRAS